MRPELAAIGNRLPGHAPLSDLRAVGGGSISSAWRAESAAGPLFIKTGPAAREAMFRAEAEGLRVLRAAAAVRVPAVLACGRAGNQAFLVLEWLELAGGVAGAALGERLAALHRCTAESFGWAHDNFIGATPQPNGWCDDWAAFWRERRLGHQLRLAAEQGYDGRLQQAGAQLLERLDRFFDGYRPVPSLLHGDLWGGNQARLADGTPVLFDPAVYHGDRETDLAMSELFGGFGREFYAAYDAAWPRDPGYRARRGLYQLYHVLNHCNLFGGGYAARAEALMQRLLAELRA